MHHTTPTRPHRPTRRSGAAAGLTALVSLALLVVGCTVDRNPLADIELPSADWIAALPHAANSGDVYASLESQRLHA